MEKDNLTSSFMALREKLHRSALGFLKDDEDARDALQDTFMKLWKNGPMESEPEARNKLFAVLRNVCIDKLRRPHTISIENPDADMAISGADSYEDVERLETLITSELTDIQKRIYNLVTHDGMEYEDIASNLGMSIESVRMNMSRARKKIRENYNKLNR